MSLEGLERRFGLPKLSEVVSLATSPTGKRVEKVISQLLVLSKDSEGIKSAIELLRTVERLDQQGTLQRLIVLLHELAPLTKGKTAQLLVQKLDKLERLLEVLLKEE